MLIPRIIVAVLYFSFVSGIRGATFDVPSGPQIGTYCVPIIRNDAGQFCDPVQVNAFPSGCRMTRECRYVLESQWPVTQNRRFHPEAVMTVFVRPSRPMLPAADYCITDRGVGAYVAYVNQWAFYHAREPLPRCVFSDYGTLTFAEANAIWTNPNNLRIPRELVLPVPWNIQSIRPPTQQELLRYFPEPGAPTGEANRFFFLQAPDGNRGPAYESTLGGSIARAFSEFVVPRSTSEIWHPQNDIRVYFNKRPICSSNYNEWHQTNHRSSPNTAVTEFYGFGSNRLSDEVRSVATHNTATYPFDDEADVAPSFTSIELDCSIFIQKDPSDTAGAVRFARIAQCIGQAPRCSDANNCVFDVKVNTAFASNRGASCLFPTPLQMVGPTCQALFETLRDATPSRLCACGNGQFINTPDNLQPYFVGWGYGLTSLAVSRAQPDPAAEFLLAYPLWTWAGEKYLSFEFARENYCELHGAIHDVPSWPAALITSGILALANSYSRGFRRDVGKQHVGTATVEFRQIFSPEVVLLAPGLRNDDRLTIADLQYTSTPVFAGRLARDGSNRRMTIRGFDQGAAAPRPLNARSIDFERISKLLPRCRLTYPYSITRYPPNSTAYANWLRATGSTIQPRPVPGAFDLNSITTVTYVDGVPSNDFFIHTHATVYRDDPTAPNNNYGNIELRNGDLYQAYVPFQSAAIGIRTYNDFDPIQIAFETATVASLLPPCDCRSDTTAASLPGGVACNLPASGDQQYRNEVNLQNPEVGTYQLSPTNCSIFVEDAIPGTLSSDVLVMQSRFYEARALFEPSTTQNHGIIWYAWQLDGAGVGTAVIGNSTARSAFYNLRSIPIKFNSPGFYTLTLGISTGRTRLFLQCSQRFQVLAGCPGSFVAQSTSITTPGHPVTLSAMMPDNGIGGSFFTFNWNVFSSAPAGLASSSTITKAGNAVVSFTSTAIGEFLVSLDVVGFPSPLDTSVAFCRSSALYKISVVNDTSAFNRFVNPDALVIPTVCLGSVGNFSTDELPGTTKSIEESSLLSAMFSLNKNVFNTFFSDQFESKALEISTVVAAALGLPTSRTDPMRGKQVKTGSRLGAGTAQSDVKASEVSPTGETVLSAYNTIVIVTGSILFGLLMLSAAVSTSFFQRVYALVYDTLFRRTLFEALRHFDRQCMARISVTPDALKTSFTYTRTYAIRGTVLTSRLRSLFCLPDSRAPIRMGSITLRYQDRTIHVDQVELYPFGKQVAELENTRRDKKQKRVYELSEAVELFRVYRTDLGMPKNTTGVADRISIEVPREASHLIQHFQQYRGDFAQPVWLAGKSKGRTETYQTRPF